MKVPGKKTPFKVDEAKSQWMKAQCLIIFLTSRFINLLRAGKEVRRRIATREDVEQEEEERRGRRGM